MKNESENANEQSTANFETENTAKFVVPPTPRGVGTQFYEYDPRVNIVSPADNTFLAPHAAIVGNASCTWRLNDTEEGPIDSGLLTIVSVIIQVDNVGTFNAVPTGSADLPWATWSFTLPDLPTGPITLRAHIKTKGLVEGNDDIEFTGIYAVARHFTVDAVPPTFTVEPPKDVLLPAPPYTTSLKGTAADDASGVAAVEWLLGDGGFIFANGTTDWRADVTFPSLGSFTVAVRARDNVGNVSAVKNVTVVVGDTTAPSLAITEPEVDAKPYPLQDGKATIPVRGTASDTQTGVALVEWSLDGNATFSPATPKAAGDWSIWTAQIPVTAAGSHTITIRALDNATPPNVATAEVGVGVAEPFQPKDPEAVFSPAAYLDDLLNFAIFRGKTSSTGPSISRQLLVDTYLQPFSDLVTRENRVVANQPVNQVRLCIEVLRRYLTKNAKSVPAPAEAAYRQAAYFALLGQLGTSYDEMRLARVASEPARTALANRLGIALADRLDQLLFQPADLTEAALEKYFGLEVTNFKPLADSLLPEPQLLIWQKEHLRTAWQQQDDAARSTMDTPLPVIDPDLLIPEDLRTPSSGNAAYDLWKIRGESLRVYQVDLDKARKAQPTPQAGFDQIVGEAVAPIADLLALAERRQRGDAIDIPLRAKLLGVRPFLHLLRIRELAVAGTVLDAEWEDVYAILTQVKKLSQFATWRDEEKQKGLILGPDFFRLSDAAQSLAGLSQWRFALQSRQAWRRTLESRLQQELTLKQAMQSVVVAAEDAALPMLRDACVATIAADRDSAVIADQLTKELGIDCKDSGRQKTTRVQQALETLQEVLLSLRTGRLKDAPPVLGTANPAAGWVLALDPHKYSEANFDEEWRWMGGYATWNAAMRVFAYPESYLLPELRPASSQTSAYGDLMTNLRNQPRLTPIQARKLARNYLEALTKEPLNPPSVPTGVVITDQLTDKQLADQRKFIHDTFFAGITDPFEAPNYVQEIFYFVPMALAMQLQKSGQYLAALDWIETVYTDHFAINERKIYHGLLLEEKISTQYHRDPDTWLRDGLNPHKIATVRTSANTRFTLMTLARCYLDFADSEFARDEGEAVARARALYGTALELLALPEMQQIIGTSGGTPFPPNPVPQALKLRAEVNLFKLRNGRNIAGIERQATSLVQPSLNLDRLPLANEAQRRFRPTPYRYAVLVERAKNLVSIAQQVEQAFLAALEKRDAEHYNKLKAGHDLDLSKATVELQDLRIKEAEDGITLAERQQGRAETQQNTYQDWISDGLNGWEISMLASQAAAGLLSMTLVEADATLTAAQAFVSATSGGFMGTGASPAASTAAAVVAAAAFARAGVATLQIAAETNAQISAAKASFERRNQEWEFQRQLAATDVAIGAQQVVLATSHKAIADKEKFISTTQQLQAEATVNFLTNKFTNEELYAWMSGILGGAYNYFLQQATAMAQLAQYQLAFERQETPPAFIKADYWDTSDETAQPANDQSKQPDRQGLTGSVRLLQDITRLDEFAFETNRRKLQLAETISLARLFPVEFQRFRETGRLSFATPMTLFDQGFPGHYLRLIKRVSMSIVALVPPTRGVRATLIASGISRVVTGGDVFQTIVVRRDPEQIAFTSTSNANGLLELEPDVGMLRPFESMGVDTNWELQLPKAANPFDFRTIADVLFTVEYTALQDFSYRKQVIQQLGDTVSAERIFSIRDQFADQWYALHNPDQEAAPMTVKFALMPDSFPPNLDDLRIQQVLLGVVRAQGRSFEVGATQLMLTPQGETVAVGGAVGGSSDGMVSTRRGNGSAWLPLIGKSPAGTWELTLPNTEEMKNRFKNQEIDDLILVLTYEGHTPTWPE